MGCRGDVQLIKGVRGLYGVHSVLPSTIGVYLDQHVLYRCETKLVPIIQSMTIVNVLNQGNTCDKFRD